MSAIPPNPITIELACDAAAYTAALDELSAALPEIADTAPEFLLRLDGLRARRSITRKLQGSRKHYSSMHSGH